MPAGARAPADAGRRRGVRARLIGLALACAALCGASLAAQAQGVRLPEGPGADLVYAKCRTCHDLQYVVDARGLQPAQWRAVLAGMKEYGLEIDAHDQQQVLAYLVTYLGPAAPPAATSPSQASVVDGRAVFERNCASCHGPDGRGRPGYYPPLAGNPDLARDVAFPVLVLLHGLAGPIRIGESSYDSAMPAFDHLSDAEIAAVVNHIRTSWGNAKEASPGRSTAQAVAARRTHPMSPAEVRAYRASMK